MPISIQCSPFPLSVAVVEAMWREVQILQHVPDDVVTIRGVTAAESQTLNKQYRGKDTPTNVLTFTYPVDEQFKTGTEHDVCICLDVVEHEAPEKNISLQDWTRWVVVHALLHVAGMDHERSSQEAVAMAAAEKTILNAVTGVE